MFLPEENCPVPSFRLTDWDEIARLKEEASRLAEVIRARLRNGGAVSWDDLKMTAYGNLTLWKLLLKDLRLMGMNIGNSKDPIVRLPSTR